MGSEDTAHGGKSRLYGQALNSFLYIKNKGSETPFISQTNIANYTLCLAIKFLC